MARGLRLEPFLVRLFNIDRLAFDSLFTIDHLPFTNLLPIWDFAEKRVRATWKRRGCLTRRNSGARHLPTRGYASRTAGDSRWTARPAGRLPAAAGLARRNA